MQPTDQEGKPKPSSKSHPDAQKLLGNVLMKVGKERGLTHYETRGKELVEKANSQLAQAEQNQPKPTE